MFIYPELNPVALRIGPLAIHWYGLMYLIGFLSAWLLACHRLRVAQITQNPQLTAAGWSMTEVNDLIFYTAIGVILGGRLGYMLIYNFPMLWSDPVSLFKVWQGGMSFHGGFIGVLLALCLFSRLKHKPLLQLSDFISPLVPIGLAAGRLGNFINGELWGRVTTVPWAMIYPHVDGNPRHPSQLYEFLLEGVALFLLVWIYSLKPRPRGATTGVFLMGYAIARLLSECFRQPDPQLGFIAFGWLTMGQLLSIPLLLLGLIFFIRAKGWR